jgi:hypothetical protein
VFAIIHWVLESPGKLLKKYTDAQVPPWTNWIRLWLLWYKAWSSALYQLSKWFQCAARVRIPDLNDLKYITTKWNAQWPLKVTLLGQGCNMVAECLPSMCEVLSSIPNIPPQKRWCSWIILIEVERCWQYINLKSSSKVPSFLEFHVI